MRVHDKFYFLSFSLDTIEEVLAYTLEKIVQFIRRDCENVFTADIYSNTTNHTTRVSSSHTSSFFSAHVSCIIECNYVLQVLSAVLECWKSREHYEKKSSQSEEYERNMLTKFICNSVAYSTAHGLSVLVHPR